MFEFAVCSPAVCNDAALAIAASRAGALGVVDLQFTQADASAPDRLERVAALSHGRWSVLVDDERRLEAILEAGLTGLESVLVAGHDGDRISSLVECVRHGGLTALAVATDAEQALAAQAAGAEAVIAKGHEAAGWVGEEGSFVLLQRLLDALEVPVWVHGGIGLHTVAAAHAAGAAGAVLDGAMLLARESQIPDELRAAVAAMDGSETTILGAEAGRQIRLHARSGVERLTHLRDLEGKLAGAGHAREAWSEAVRGETADAPPRGAAVTERLLPLGQDAAFAADLSRRFGTVAGILAALREAIGNAAEALRHSHPLAEDAPLARSHGTRYPVVQGPMTRVSDRAEFAAAVAQAGALPFLALALMRAAEVNPLLERARALAGDRPWGVGVLGFVPPELRAEQLEAVLRYRPPFTLIAGGRPDQARQLEQAGIATYLHAPSPGLLKLYLADGARRFVFEGRECGGHVGPRTSFVLWETMLSVLADELPAGTEDCHVLFAGGIHDARSAAMVSAMAAPAAARGIKVGVLLGTAYLFTREATECGAITPTFQEAAIAATETALLESGPGHATRCLHSPFVEQFEAEKSRLRADGLAGEALRGELEQLNIGRLRIAAKGADRDPRRGTEADAPKLVAVEASEQWERGMYMIGQVAALRDGVTTLAELHDDVCAGSSELLAGLTISETEAPSAPPPADVAIIGLGCILPKAPDVGVFWANILGKVDAIGEIPAERWDWRRLYDPDPAARDKVYSRWGGFIDPVPFDPIAIGMPPKSLASIEPFQLLALVTAQAALGDAGYATRPFARERTSVILGAGGGGADLSVGYTVRSALPSLLGDSEPALQRRLYDRLPEWTEDSFAGLLMNVAAGRIANRLDFGGTNYTVDAACASSLAAIGLGARELHMGTSDMVLAGGVDAIQNPFAFLCFAKTHALSPRGRCRPFDATADGIAISEGFATVVLKRLDDAERDGDRIYAVIRGVGAASDGRDRSLTAPRPEGQMRALRRAYAQAGISPATVELVEAHGTGTVAGDGAEVQALSTVFSEHGAERQWCAIGSVKSMIGHTKATAGVAGLIKAALALHHRVLPPTIGVTEPNPKANFPDSPFYVNSEARPWLTGAADHPRRAGVSAFGFGGTDFHLVLEEYTGGYLADRESAVERWPGELLLWRGTRAQISDSVAKLAEGLETGAEPRLADLAYTLALEADAKLGSEATLALVAESIDDLRGKLEAARALLAGDGERLHTPNGVHFSERGLAAAGGLAFLFPGQGSQAVDMARELTLAFPEARDAFELADRVLAGEHDRPLSRYVFPPPSFDDAEAQRRREELTATNVAQPALGAAELAYLGVLASLGVEPAMTAGHSYGELVALGAAGALDPEPLLALSAARGRLMHEAAAGEAGAMAAVDAAPAALEPLLDAGRVVAANLNGPQQTVLSGPRDCVEEAVTWCRDRDLRARLLPVACAFHSPHVAGAQRRFAETLAAAPLRAPRIPVFSNTTACAHSDDPAAIAEVLGRQLVEPVQFVDEIDSMYGAGARVFVEVGPKAVLTGLAGQILGDREHLAVAVDRPGRSGLLSLLHCLAAVAAEGVPVRGLRLLRGRRVERLDLLRPAGAAEPARPGQWLVDGGAARPADGHAPNLAAAGAVRPAADTNGASTHPSTPPEEPEPVNRPDMHGAAPPGADLVPEPAFTNGNGYGPPAPASHPIAPAADRVAEVMTSYQRLMQQFLETERAVMLGYLTGARPDQAGPRPAPLTLAPPRAIAVAPLVATPLPVDMPRPTETAALLAAVSPPASTVPESAAPTAAPAEAGNGHRITSPAEIEAHLLALVSERTGYPADMLGLDADMEGDLGIDSIKRVEIAGTFTQTLSEQHGATFDMEQLTASRTLRQVVALLVSALAPKAPVPGAGEPSPFEPRPAETERIGRFSVTVASAPAITPTAALAGSGAVVILDDGTGLAESVAASLSGHGEAVVLRPGSAPGDDREAAELAAWIRSEHGGAKALIHLASADAEYGGLATLFLLVQALRDDLEAAAQTGGAAVIGVTRLGGTFGIDDDVPAGAAEQRAIPGFLKTLALEWPTVRVKAVDLAADAGPEAAEQLRAELTAADGLVEVGYRRDERLRLALSPAPLAARPVGDRPVAENAVLLITGGARGITAEVALALAEGGGPTLVLTGRTTIDEEPAATAGLADPAALRQALIEARRRAGQELKPVLVEQECRRVLAAREARHNIARLRASGATVEYHRCDVGDPHAFAALIDGIYERHGRIDGVVHGAGLIEDRLIADKRLESVERVLRTKAASARLLADKLRPQTLRFLVLFSSVSGRFGNRGQADYAAASEVLAGLAHELDRRWDARVVAIDWGPWSGTGMVSAELEREFARRGVTLIGVEEGCRRLLAELQQGADGEAEVVVGAASGLSAGAAAASSLSADGASGTAVLADPPAPPDLAQLPLLATAAHASPPAAGGIDLHRRLRLDHDLYLDDHRVDGHAVFPFAVAMEMMAEAASVAAGRAVSGLREIRLLKGITVPDRGHVGVRVSAAPRPAGDLEMAIGAIDGSRLHYRCVAVHEGPDGPGATGEASPAPLPELAPFPMTVREAYRELLFHGPMFQSITAIRGMDERGSAAELRASDPGSCLTASGGLKWSLDPVLLDAALQVQVLWARLQWDVTLLPAEIGAYQRLGDLADGDRVGHELRIRPESKPPMCHADHWFFAADGRPVAILADVVGVGTQALNRLAVRS